LLTTKRNNTIQCYILIVFQDYNLHESRSEPRSSGHIFTDSSGGLFSFSSPVSSLSAISPSIIGSQQTTPTIGVSLFSGGRSSMATRTWSTGFTSLQGPEIGSRISRRISAAGTLKVACSGLMFVCSWQEGSFLLLSPMPVSGSAEDCFSHHIRF